MSSRYEAQELATGKRGHGLAVRRPAQLQRVFARRHRCVRSRRKKRHYWCVAVVHLTYITSFGSRATIVEPAITDGLYGIRRSQIQSANTAVILDDGPATRNRMLLRNVGSFVHVTFWKA